MSLEAFRSGKGGILIPCDLSKVTWEVVSKASMNPSVPKSPSRALPIQGHLSRLSLFQYSLCKQGRQCSDRLCLRAILIALLFCWGNTDAVICSPWSLQPGYCSGSHQMLLFPKDTWKQSSFWGHTREHYLDHQSPLTFISSHPGPLLNRYSTNMG